MWKRVEDEIPPRCLNTDEDSSDDVLVQLDDGTMDVSYYDFVAKNWMDRWGFKTESGSKRVTHWQPLPESAEE